MAQVLTFPEPISFLSVRRSSREKLSDAEYWAFCEANPELRLERNAEGEIVILSTLGGELVRELANWAKIRQHGIAFGPTVQYVLRDGSALSPDASWVSNESLARLTNQQRQKFLRLTPEFVVEVLSPSDSLQGAKAKMECWVLNGVQLAWLIDSSTETVHVYQPGAAPKTRRHARELEGTGPMAGFILDLMPIWRGL